jgi:hypothetical protein
MLPENVTIEDVMEFLLSKKSDERVIAMLDELVPEKPLTAEKVSAFLGTDEGKALIQPMMDSRVTEAIKTYKSGHYEKELKAAVAAEILKLNPQETAEQRRIRELEEKDAQRDKEAARDKLRSQIKELAYQQSINPKFVDSLEFNSVEEAALYFKNFKSEIETAQQNKANELLAAGYKPGSGSDQGKKGVMSGKEYAALPFEERIRMQESGEADQMMSGQ